MARMTVAVWLVLIAAAGTAQPAIAAGPWRELHRPLDLPEVPAGEPCPVSPVDQRVDWPSTNIFGGSGTGPGPVYPGIGSEPVGSVETMGAPIRGPWFGGKVFWYVTPAYRGRVLIRGRRLDGPESLRFTDEGAFSRELRIRRRTSVSWKGQPPGSRGEPSGVLVRSSGCYGVQVDGTRFSRTVVFTASTP